MKVDIKVGDVLLGGQFKNRRIVVKSIGTDENGQPTINGKKLLTFRIEKKLPKQLQSKATREKLEKKAYEGQYTIVDGKPISIAELIKALKGVEGEEVSLSDLSWKGAEKPGIEKNEMTDEKLERSKDRIEAADLKYPILTHKVGDRKEVLDGTHRIIKALYSGKPLKEIEVFEDLLKQAWEEDKNFGATSDVGLGNTKYSTPEGFDKGAADFKDSPIYEQYKQERVYPKKVLNDYQTPLNPSLYDSEKGTLFGGRGAFKHPADIQKMNKPKPVDKFKNLISTDVIDQKLALRKGELTDPTEQAALDYVLRTKRKEKNLWADYKKQTADYYHRLLQNNSKPYNFDKLKQALKNQGYKHKIEESGPLNSFFGLPFKKNSDITIGIPKDNYQVALHESAHSLDPTVVEEVEEFKTSRDAGLIPSKPSLTQKADQELVAMAVETMASDIEKRKARLLEIGDQKGYVYLKLLEKHLGTMTGDPEKDIPKIKQIMDKWYGKGEFNKKLNQWRKHLGATSDVGLGNTKYSTPEGFDKGAADPRTTLEMELEHKDPSQTDISEKQMVRDLIKEHPDLLNIDADPSLDRTGIEVTIDHKKKARTKKLLKKLKEMGYGTSYRTGLHIHSDFSDKTPEQVFKMLVKHHSGLADNKNFKSNTYHRHYNPAEIEDIEKLIAEGDYSKEKVLKVLDRHSYSNLDKDNLWGADSYQTRAVNIIPYLVKYYKLKKRERGGGYGSVEFRTGYADDPSFKIRDINIARVMKALDKVKDIRKVSGVDKQANDLDTAQSKTTREEQLEKRSWEVNGNNTSGIEPMKMLPVPEAGSLKAKLKSGNLTDPLEQDRLERYMDVRKANKRRADINTDIAVQQANDLGQQRLPKLNTPEIVDDSFDRLHRVNTPMKRGAYLKSPFNKTALRVGANNDGKLYKQANDLDTAVKFVKKTFPNYFKKSPNAEAMLKETANVESLAGKLTHPDPNYKGGMFQIDKGTFKDLQSAGPGKYPKLYKRLQGAKNIDVSNLKWGHLKGNPHLSALFAALKYMTVPKAIPGTREGRAKYWKQYYNTSAGKGTAKHYLKMNPLEKENNEVNYDQNKLIENAAKTTSMWDQFKKALDRARKYKVPKNHTVPATVRG
jgi:hypothetical protein